MDLRDVLSPGQTRPTCCGHRTAQTKMTQRKLIYRFSSVFCFWICTMMMVPARVDATWMWLGAASLGTAVVGPGSTPQQEPTADPLSSILIDPARVCRQFPGLTPDQRRVCESTPDIINVISEGAKVGIVECQRQFSTERWNCTVIGDVDNPFGKVMKTGNRESAFIYAITSAGVVYAVTRSCSLGNLTECGCAIARGHPGSEALGEAEDWRWGGCSDDVDYGIKLARKFVDSADKTASSSSPSSTMALDGSARPRTSAQVTEMNLHNNEAARQVIKSEMMTQCRCHGVSASCSMKTCWKTMPTFRQIGDLIKDRYRNGVEVVLRTKKKKAKLRRRERRMRRVPIGDDQLVYMQRSPNYCQTDPDRGIVGTTGRHCNRTSTGSDSCGLLCCGRGYNTQEVRRVERCECKFVWCCKVTCRVCETVEDTFTCK